MRRSSKRLYATAALAGISTLLTSQVASAAALTWNNNNGTTNVGDGVTWDTTQLNWNNGSLAFTNGDDPTFNDANNGNYGVNVPGSISAGAMTVATDSVATGNVANHYTFTIADGQTLSASSYTQGVAPTGATNTQTDVTITGGGTFNVTSATNANFAVGVGAGSNTPAGRPLANLDMSGLSNFVFSTGTGYFGVGNLVTRATSTAKLANTSNSITAATLGVGDSNQNSAGNNGGGANTLSLGAGTNLLNVNSIIVGNTKSSGVITWVGNTGSVTINGEGGTGTTADITVAQEPKSSGTSTTSSLLLAGHDSTVNAGTVQVGLLDGATGGKDVGTLTFDTGTFTATNLNIGNDTSGSAPNGSSGTFTLGADNTSTGVLNVSAGMLLGNVTNASTVTKTDAGAFVINGGTANIGADIISLKNPAATGTTLTTTLTLAGGTLNMNGHAIGASGTNQVPISQVNLPAAGQTATLSSLGGTGINGAGLTLSSGGTLNLTGTNTYTGNTAVTSGTLLLMGSYTGGGTFSVGTGATLGGTGSTTSGVTVASGGTLAPGDALGTLSVGSATIAGTLQIALNDASTPNVDELMDSGSLDISDPGSAVNFNVTGTPSQSAYIFATYGSLTGTFGTATGVPSGYTIDYNYQGKNDIALVSSSAVPEPASLGLLALGALGMIPRRRRDRK